MTITNTTRQENCATQDVSKKLKLNFSPKIVREILKKNPGYYQMLIRYLYGSFAVVSVLNDFSFIANSL